MSLRKSWKMRGADCKEPVGKGKYVYKYICIDVYTHTHTSRSRSLSLSLSLSRINLHRKACWSMFTARVRVVRGGFRFGVLVEELTFSYQMGGCQN